MKHVIVTGANKGIGLAIAKELVSQGCFVFLASRDIGRGEVAVAELASENAAFKELLQVVQLDVLDAASVDACAAAIKAKGVLLHALVNNVRRPRPYLPPSHTHTLLARQPTAVCAHDSQAGGAVGSGGLSYCDHASHTGTVELNFYSAVRVTKAILPLIDPDGGRVVNVGIGVQ